MVDTTVNDGGDGPEVAAEWSQEDYHHPAAGWGAAVSVGQVLKREHALLSGPRAMLKMNHENGGFDCPGCAWPDATDGLKLDLCENGVKHVVWEMTPDRPAVSSSPGTPSPNWRPGRTSRSRTPAG